jgi:hypothetical protein
MKCIKSGIYALGPGKLPSYSEITGVGYFAAPFVNLCRGVFWSLHRRYVKQLYKMKMITCYFFGVALKYAQVCHVKTVLLTPVHHIQKYPVIRRIIMNPE